MLVTETGKTEERAVLGERLRAENTADLDLNILSLQCQLDSKLGTYNSGVQIRGLILQIKIWFL